MGKVFQFLMTLVVGTMDVRTASVTSEEQVVSSTVATDGSIEEQFFFGNTTTDDGIEVSIDPIDSWRSSSSTLVRKAKGRTVTADGNVKVADSLIDSALTAITELQSRSISRDGHVTADGGIFISNSLMDSAHPPPQSPVRKVKEGHVATDGLAEPQQSGQRKDNDNSHTNLRTPQKYLSACGADDGDTLRFPFPVPSNCYLGCGLWQVHSALRVGQAAGKKFMNVRQAKTHEYIRQIFELPDKVPIAPSPKLGCEIASEARTSPYHIREGEYDCSWTKSPCKSTIAERLVLYEKSLKPYLRPAVLGSCKAPSEDTVTLHIRDGDVIQGVFDSTSAHGAHHQPPCEFYHQVIEYGYDGKAFPRISLVFDEKWKPLNPCVADIQKKFRSRIMPQKSGSMLYDYCQIIRAKNLAVPPSSFSTTAKMFNSDLRRLFFFNHAFNIPSAAATFDLHLMNYDFDPHEACEVYPHVVAYGYSNASLHRIRIYHQC